MGSFMRRLIALTCVWLLATAALTYAAAQRMGATPTAPPAAATTTPAAPKILVVPDVRSQAYVFAKGTLGDAGFGWRVKGSVKGFAANTVAAQSPAPGTRVVDTGAPLIVLHLAQSKGKELGIPDAVSPLRPTALRLADLTVAPVKHVAAAPKKKVAVKKKATVVKKQATVVKRTPSKKTPERRPPAFAVAGARREPLSEPPLTVRANNLLKWLQRGPKPTDANVQYWLYQHAWIVAGARMGWWHGSSALQTLVTVDNRVWALWGIGARSEAIARSALAEVEARSS
jgi:hypothetical protein